MDKPTKKEIEAYMLNKFAGQHGGLKPKNISWELADGYEFAYKEIFGGKKKCVTIIKST